MGAAFRPNSSVVEGSLNLHPLVEAWCMWARLLDLVQKQNDLTLGMIFLDGTTICTRHKAVGAEKRARRDLRRQRKIHYLRPDAGTGA